MPTRKKGPEQPAEAKDKPEVEDNDTTHQGDRDTRVTQITKLTVDELGIPPVGTEIVENVMFPPVDPDRLNICISAWIERNQGYREADPPKRRDLRGSRKLPGWSVLFTNAKKKILTSTRAKGRRSSSKRTRRR